MNNHDGNGKGTNQARYTLAINSLGKHIFEEGDKALAFALENYGDGCSSKWSEATREAVFKKLTLSAVMELKEDVTYLNKQVFKLIHLMEDLGEEKNDKGKS
tara:strand:+ start:57 stop:362 length:306 start_codon:yes stop_codon:yes gene_type:complete